MGLIFVLYQQGIWLQALLSSQNQLYRMRQSIIQKGKATKSSSRVEAVNRKKSRRSSDEKEEPLRCLLHQGRSLKQLFDGMEFKQRSLQVKKESDDLRQEKHYVQIDHIVQDKKVDLKLERSKLLSKNEYMMGDNRKLVDNKKIHKAADLKIVNTSGKKGQQLSKESQLREKQCKIHKSNEKQYDPENYNWRKSLSRQKESFSMLGSPRPVVSIKSSREEYYPSKNVSNLLKSKQSSIQESKRKKPCKSKSLESDQYREVSPRSKPKVIKHIFDLKRAKVVKQPVISPKSLLFTFGL